MKKLIEGTLLGVRKSAATHEPAPTVKMQRRLKSGTAARLQTEPSHAAYPRHADDVIEECRRDSAPQEVRMSAHRLDLSGAITKVLQRPDPGDSLPDGHCPYRHCRRREARQIECEHIARRRIRVHCLQVQAQQVAGLLP